MNHKLTDAYSITILVGALTRRRFLVVKPVAGGDVGADDVGGVVGADVVVPGGVVGPANVAGGVVGVGVVGGVGADVFVGVDVVVGGSIGFCRLPLCVFGRAWPPSRCGLRVPDFPDFFGPPRTRASFLSTACFLRSRRIASHHYIFSLIY